MLTRIKDATERALTGRRFRQSLTRMHGPAQFDSGPSDVIVMTPVLNGAWYLPEFLRHYRALGARHFVFLDNGSTDATVAMLADEPGVAVLQSPLPLGPYEREFRQHMARVYGPDRWCLFVDTDEVFDWEGHAQGLAALTAGLTEMGATALVAQMLEMFPTCPLRDAVGWDYARVQRDFGYCDLTHITRFGYLAADNPLVGLLTTNRLLNPALSYLFGGVRKRVFDEDCCLTKHPLVFAGGGTSPATHPHCAGNVTVAPFTALIKHYKFANDPFGRDRAGLAAGAVSHGEDAKRLAIAADPDLTLMSPDAQPYNGIAMLQTAGFLTVADA